MKDAPVGCCAKKGNEMSDTPRPGACFACDCDPHSEKCAIGNQRTLSTTEYSQCLFRLAPPELPDIGSEDDWGPFERQ